MNYNMEMIEGLAQQFAGNVSLVQEKEKAT
jgi:hypothetical protein